MPAQTDVIRELASLLNARKEVPIARFFTGDFRLYDPGAGIWLEGHKGAQDMVEMVLAFSPNARLEILDMIEQGDRVAVRWQLTSESTPHARSASMLAIYRFANGRIAQDWGISVGAPWEMPTVP